MEKNLNFSGVLNWFEHVEIIFFHLMINDCMRLCDYGKQLVIIFITYGGGPPVFHDLATYTFFCQFPFQTVTVKLKFHLRIIQNGIFFYIINFFLFPDKK